MTDFEKKIELAKKGNPDALYALGDHRKELHDSQLNRIVAYIFYYLADSKGHKEANIEMDKLERKMTNEDIAKAKQDAWDWAEKYYPISYLPQKFNN